MGTLSRDRGVLTKKVKVGGVKSAKIDATQLF